MPSALDDLFHHDRLAPQFGEMVASSRAVKSAPLVGPPSGTINFTVRCGQTRQ
jgi:hypothetical protein